jgi:YbbR domain-containing protein
MRIITLTNENPDWLLLIMCLIIAAMTCYLLYVMLNANKKSNYYKKFNKWRKNKTK